MCVHAHLDSIGCRRAQKEALGMPQNTRRDLSRRQRECPRLPRMRRLGAVNHNASNARRSRDSQPVAQHARPASGVGACHAPTGRIAPPLGSLRATISALRLRPRYQARGCSRRHCGGPRRAHRSRRGRNRRHCGGPRRAHRSRRATS